ncbi:hypothetical protein AB0B62_30625 [Micromonospora chalcea]|uniref:hypothetical protein n=1 Tax=Micromonospora chalcea TaxID=1874 RepID=UPI0033E13910
MRTDTTIPNPDDDLPHDTFVDEGANSADEPEPPDPDRLGTRCGRADDGADLFVVLPYSGHEPRRTADWEEIALKLGDDWASKITSAAASEFVTEAGMAVQVKQGSLRRSTVITYTEPFDVDVIAHLTPPAAAPNDHTSRLIRLLKHWSHAADGQSQLATRIELKISLPRGSRRRWWDDATTHAAGWAASRAVRAALQARDAVIQEDQQAGRAVVATYVSQWLGLAPTVTMVEAAGNALLQAPLDPYDPSPDSAVVKRLRSATFLQRRAWRPIGETWLHGRRVDSLERPLRLGADEQMLTVADTLGIEDRHDIDLEGWQDRRVPRVLTQLHADERDVAMAYAHDPATTWATAARACGRPEAFGERVRRKLLRLGKNLAARLANQHAVSRAA